MEKNINSKRVCVRKQKVKGQLGKRTRIWVYNIKMDLREKKWDGMALTGWIWLRTETSCGFLRTR